jgi:hypothetical protein
MSKHACFHYQFHPVRQGLFASGCLYQSNYSEPRFLWVYDCGSVTIRNGNLGRARWNVLTGELKRFAHYRANLDLLTLSHFDQDHINGVTSLLAQFRVDMLVLPYAPLWQRLLIAFGGNHQGNPEIMDYFVDPVRFLRANGHTGRIVLVPPAEGELPPPAGKASELPDKPWPLNGRIKQVDPNEPQVIEFGTAAADSLECLDAGAGLDVLGLWEFCPYNTPLVTPPDGFPALVAPLRDDLLNADPLARQAALDALKAAYDAAFASAGGTHAWRRNVISMSLYGGPVYPTWRACKMTGEHGAALPAYPQRLPCYYRAHSYAPGETKKCSILYSGDSYLKNDTAYNHLANYLGQERMRHLGVFQVNHHGSRYNWHQGLAAKLEPWLSVFSSAPGLPPGHPHAEVLQDFAGHQPVQVDGVGHGAGGWMLL